MTKTAEFSGLETISLPWEGMISLPSFASYAGMIVSDPMGLPWWILMAGVAFLPVVLLVLLFALWRP